jgi:hypothetical protein
MFLNFLKLITLKDVAYKIDLAWESISKWFHSKLFGRKFVEYFYGDLLYMFFLRENIGIFENAHRFTSVSLLIVKKYEMRSYVYRFLDH